MKYFSLIFVLSMIVFLSACTNETQTDRPTLAPGGEEVTSRPMGATGLPATSDRYIEFGDGALEVETTARRVLFFYASWCPTCRPVDAEISQRAEELPEDVTVIRVNYNDPDTDQAEKDLARKYVVTYQHTFVQIDQDGNEVTKWNGGDMDQLLKRIK